ncbi:MAG TPA: zinc-dependent metalloprotease [Vicinamibacterales bacterium]|nr:zinc-dependent metalloprotease [Vicinamibacterales bacterium]
MKRILEVVTLLLVVGAGAASAQERGGQVPAKPGEMPTIAAKTAGMQKIDGFFPLYWDEAAGLLWLEIPRFDEDLLYVSGLSAGVGSNDIGLDRGQLSGSRLVRFQRVGPRVLMVQPNTRYRAVTGSADEKRAVEDSFAASILWGFTAAARGDDGAVLVDATDFLMRDAHGVVSRLRPATFRLDRTRSAVYLPRTKAFPRNTEMEVTLTFTADGSTAGAGGGFEKGALNAVVPSADAVTVRQHHSLVALPGPGFVPRRFDPRAGFGDFSYEDYSAPLGQPTVQRFIRKHRLEKREPAAKVSEPVEPIVYYVDRGVPEPIRSAVLEGVRWWNQAFEAAGYRDAFRAELLPEDADPMDVRYNVVQWVHRSTRGWSYGGGVSDPRTGEIIQGHVTLGSLRIRQDYLIAEALTAPYAEGSEAVSNAARDMGLARIRQLAAHEVGHAIGFGHQYYDSTIGYISVMDYPHPRIGLAADGTPDLSQAYPAGIGEWDKVAVAWGYQHFPNGVREEEALQGILDEAWARDLKYLSNQDADYNPRVDQWANGADVAAELNRMMTVRRAALNRFGEQVLRRGEPLALAEEALVPLYLHHRYQAEAVASAIGGLSYHYALRGDARTPWTFVPAAQQLAALDALIATLDPAELAVPGHVLQILAPRPDGFPRHRELFPRNTGLPFDILTPATVAADMTIAFVLRPDRAARLVNQEALDPSLPGFDEVVGRLVESTFAARPGNAYEAGIARVVQRVLTERLMALAASAPAPQVRAIASRGLAGIRERVRVANGGAGAQGGRRQQADEEDLAHRALLAADITRFLDRPFEPARPIALPAPPPGAPIGDPDQWWIDASPAAHSGWWRWVWEQE